MNRFLAALALTTLLAVPTQGCSTIAGTIVSPITGGVDLCRVGGISRSNWYMAPVFFVGGVVAGPFVAFYNGLSYDASVFGNFESYWTGFDGVFRPFEMIYRR